MKQTFTLPAGSQYEESYVFQRTTPTTDPHVVVVRAGNMLHHKDTGEVKSIEAIYKDAEQRICFVTDEGMNHLFIENFLPKEFYWDEAKERAKKAENKRRVVFDVVHHMEAIVDVPPAPEYASINTAHQLEYEWVRANLDEIAKNGTLLSTELVKDAKNCTGLPSINKARP